jgi:hypothetical protein
VSRHGCTGHNPVICMQSSKQAVMWLLLPLTVKISSLARCSMSMSAEQSVENKRPLQQGHHPQSGMWLTALACSHQELLRNRLQSLFDCCWVVGALQNQCKQAFTYS